MNKLLFIVETPFQLLSAMEAKYYFNNYESILLIKYSPQRTHAQNNQQMKNILYLTSWDNIEIVECAVSTRISNYKLLFFMNTLQKKYGKFSKVFIGEYRSWVQKKYLEILNPEEQYLLDDGNMTIELQKNYIPNNKKYVESKSLISTVDNLFQNTVLCFFDTEKKKKELNLFTCFNLESYSSKQTIIKHSFAFSKQLIKDKILLKNTVYFFGSNISELGCISEEYEFELLKKIINRYKSMNIEVIYLPHRRESQKKLKKITKILGVELRISTYPAEIEFIMMDYIPEYIASMISTTLISVPKIVDFKNVTSFQLDYNKIEPYYLIDIRNSYDYYKKKLEIVDLNEY